MLVLSILTLCFIVLSLFFDSRKTIRGIKKGGNPHLTLIIKGSLDLPLSGFRSKLLEQLTISKLITSLALKLPRRSGSKIPD